MEEGIVPGGGVALLNVSSRVRKLADKSTGDFKTGVNIILRALEEPIRQITTNAGVDGAVVVENVLRENKPGYGYNAAKGTYSILADEGIIDPTKVVRSALQNAASVAAMMITTESLVTDIPTPPAPAAAPGPDMGGMY